MLSLRKWLGKINKRYAALAGLLVVLLILAIVVTPGNNKDSSKKNTDKANQMALTGKGKGRQISYTYVSSNITCSDYPSYPGADTTINLCEGTLTVVNQDTKKNQEFKVTSASHLYDTGHEQPLSQLSNLQSGVTKLNLVLDKSDKSKVSNIIFYSS